MREAATTYGWQLNFGGIAGVVAVLFGASFYPTSVTHLSVIRIYRTCCWMIFFIDAVSEAFSGWRKAVVKAIEIGVPVPTFSSALSFYDGYRSKRLPANLLQTQRDYFGAHTYERLDKPRGEFFHTNWTGRGGNISASNYDVRKCFTPQ